MACLVASSVAAQVEIRESFEIRLPSEETDAQNPADSNSPAIWEIVDGQPVLHVFTSINGRVSRSVGWSLEELEPAQPVEWGEPGPPPGGTWMEAVISTPDAWYGFYHNEQTADECPELDKVEPRIGAARSTDRGSTWTDLGLILRAQPGTMACDTPNRYFVGGIGDFSAILDGDERYVYFFLSQYDVSVESQGVIVARMVWADRDDPVGKMSVWQEGAWVPAEQVPVAVDEEGNSYAVWSYPTASPLVPTADSWHQGATADALWGPSVHWNTHLEQYVMLLNRTRSVGWDPEGVYVSFNDKLDDPAGWSQPRKLVNGGAWYPQVMGVELAEGTDKLAGRFARFFMGGVSRHTIEFIRQP